MTNPLVKELQNIRDGEVIETTDYTHDIACGDHQSLVRSAKSYGNSWKQRGGAGAFMMLARKWDRLELQAKVHQYDVFRAIREDERPEGIIDDIRDLRRYLLLVEAEMVARGFQVSETKNNSA